MQENVEKAQYKTDEDLNEERHVKQSPIEDDLYERVAMQKREFRWQHPPLPLTGAKARRWWREIQAVSEVIPQNWKVFDAFGGTMCVTWIMKHHREDLDITTNDVKCAYRSRLKSVGQTCEIWKILHDAFGDDAKTENSYVKFTDAQWELLERQLEVAEDKITVMSWANGGGSPRNKLPSNPPNREFAMHWTDGMDIMDIELDSEDTESMKFIDRFDFFILDPPYMYSNKRKNYACEDYRKARRWTMAVIDSGKPFVLWDKSGSDLVIQAESKGAVMVKETKMGFTGEDGKRKEVMMLLL